jgi:hypothetical protein
MGLSKKDRKKGCGKLFSNDYGFTLTCGKRRADGNRFLCPECIKKAQQMIQNRKEKVFKANLD